MAATVIMSVFRLRFIKTYAYLQAKNTFKPDLIILLYKNSTKFARGDTPEINQNAVVNLTEKHLHWDLFLIKLHALSPATLLKGDLFSCAIC